MGEQHLRDVTAQQHRESHTHTSSSLQHDPNASALPFPRRTYPSRHSRKQTKAKDKQSLEQAHQQSHNAPATLSRTPPNALFQAHAGAIDVM